MQIEFFNAQRLRGSMKATVHNTGRLNFGYSAELGLGLNIAKSLKIGRAEDYHKEGVLYIVVGNKEEAGSFAILKQGAYYYASTRNLFDLLGEDYRKRKVVFDIEQETLDGQKVFKLKRRTIERKKQITGIKEATGQIDTRINF